MNPHRTADQGKRQAPSAPVRRDTSRGVRSLPLTLPSGNCAEVKRHLFSVMGQKLTQRTQQQHGALTPQQDKSAHGAAVFSLPPGCPTSAVTPRRAERRAHKSQKLAEEVESLSRPCEAVRRTPRHSGTLANIAHYSV
ncbi:hypothetical protein BGZ68_006928 [Mortierella alpina]|nr:hypothetical protein BGZ68_006928 [Mortierella alpina]